MMDVFSWLARSIKMDLASWRLIPLAVFKQDFPIVSGQRYWERRSVRYEDALAGNVKDHALIRALVGRRTSGFHMCEAIIIVLQHGNNLRRNRLHVVAAKLFISARRPSLTVVL